MIKNLNALRGVFILFIFLHHAGIYPGGGTLAVSFFFVLGGFVMTLGYKERLIGMDFDYMAYLVRRAVKFFPLHWICLLASAILMFVYHNFHFDDIPIFALNAALLHTWIPNQDIYFSFNAVSWYLADTMFFSIVFPFVFKLIYSTNLKGKVFVLTAVLALYIAVVLFLPVEKYHAILYIAPYMRLADFIFGIYLALIFLSISEENLTRRRSFFCVQLLPAFLIMLLVVESCLLPDNIRMVAPVYWPFVVALIIISSLTEGGASWLKWRCLQKLGKFSFTIFLTHYLVLEYCKIAFRLLHIDNKYIYIVFTFLLTIVLSLLLERYILEPVTKWLTKRIQPSTTALS